MSTWEIPCEICGEPIGSAEEMYVISETPDGIKEAAHKPCWFTDTADWEKVWTEYEEKFDRQREDAILK